MVKSSQLKDKTQPLDTHSSVTVCVKQDLFCPYFVPNHDCDDYVMYSRIFVFVFLCWGN